jgi:N-carbamoylputrescine amidase
MKIALVQQAATTDISANIARAVDAIRQAAADGAELVAFPELAFTPFYPQARPSATCATSPSLCRVPSPSGSSPSLASWALSSS